MGVDDYDDSAEQYCPECGDLLEEGDEECISCGRPVNGSED